MLGYWRWNRSGLREVRESIQININNPALNKDAGRYNLTPVWNNTLKKLGRRWGDQVPGPPTRRCSLTTSPVPPIPSSGHLMKHAAVCESLQGNADYIQIYLVSETIWLTDFFLVPFIWSILLGSVSPQIYIIPPAIKLWSTYGSTIAIRIENM